VVGEELEDQGMQTDMSLNEGLDLVLGSR